MKNKKQKRIPEVVTTIRVPAKLRDELHKRGLNISEIARDALFKAVALTGCPTCGLTRPETEDDGMGF